MTVRWRGSLAVPSIMLPSSTGRAVFAISNTLRSRSLVRILGLTLASDASDSSQNSGHVCANMRVNRLSASAISGGVQVARTSSHAWDTSIATPDSGVLVLYGGRGAPRDNQLSFSAVTGRARSAFVTRASNQSEQRRVLDSSMLRPVTPDNPFVLRPGEAIGVICHHASGNTSAEMFINIAWEEDDVADAGYSIGGTVRVGDSGVAGAKVFVVTDLDRDMPSPEVMVITTSAGGTWQATLASSVKASVFVQYRSGETLYTDRGKPYLEKN